MKRLVAVAAAGTLLCPGAAVAAGPKWKVIGNFRLTGDHSLGMIHATARNDAWAFTHGGTPSAFRWNGRAWHKVKLPRGTDEVKGVDSLGRNKVWTVGECGEGSCVMRWNGRSWKVLKRWRNAYPGNLVALSPENIWIFDRDAEDGGSNFGVHHYDGRTWQKVKTPVMLVSGTKSRNGDLWAVSAEAERPGNAPPEWLWRFDGRSWIQVRPTGLPPVVVNEQGDYLQSHAITSVAAGSRNDVVAVGNLQSYDDFEGTGKVGRAFFVRWDGRRWHREWAPKTSDPLDSVFADGAGGHWITTTDRLFHRSAKGTWSESTLKAAGRPFSFASLTRVPGTRTLMATGITGWDWDTPHRMIFAT